MRASYEPVGQHYVYATYFYLSVQCMYKIIKILICNILTAAISIIDNVNSHIRTAWNPKTSSRKTVMQVRVASLCSLRTRHWR